MGEAKFWVGLAATVVLLAGTGIFLGVNYDYRWKQQCAAANGVQMESVAGSRVCVKGPVEIVTIAARPW
jgi:hypothetical protein